MESKIEYFYDFEDLYEKWIDMGDRYEELKRNITNRLTELDKTLTEEQQKELQTIGLLYHQQEYEAGKATYKAGFKTGLGLALETISDEFKGTPPV